MFIYTTGGKYTDLCDVLPDSYTLKQCNVTNTAGTKHVAIKVDPTIYINVNPLGKQINYVQQDDVVLQAEHCSEDAEAGKIGYNYAWLSQLAVPQKQTQENPEAATNIARTNISHFASNRCDP